MSKPLVHELVAISFERRMLMEVVPQVVNGEEAWPPVWDREACSISSNVSMPAGAALPVAAGAGAASAAAPPLYLGSGDATTWGLKASGGSANDIPSSGLVSSSSTLHHEVVYLGLQTGTAVTVLKILGRHPFQKLS